MSDLDVPKEWKSMWALFDENRTGSLYKVDVKHIMRGLQRRYTEAEFDDVLSQFPEPVPFECFVKLMKEPYYGPTDEDLESALHVLDTHNTGMLKISELVSTLSSLGEKMPEVEVRQLFSDIATDKHGCAPIDEIAHFLCTPVPCITPEIEELLEKLNKLLPPK